MENKINLQDPLTEKVAVDETLQPSTTTSEASGGTLMEDFAKTSTAAKLSGTYNKATGFVKRKAGEILEDKDLQAEGLKQEALGSVHKLVGLIRETREDFTSKVHETRVEGKKILVKHGVKLMNGVSDFISDMRDLLK